MSAFLATPLGQRLTAWYNRNIQAGWYASAALIGGWLTVALAWLPDLINFGLDHIDYFVGLALPTMDAETKAVLISFYVAVIAPPLRAKLQNWMQRKSLKQAAETGKVSSAYDTESVLITVADKPPVLVRPTDTARDA